MARKLKSDKVLFLATLLLVCSSVVMVYSASAALAMNRFNQPYFFLVKQAMWAALGLAAMSIAMRFNYRNYREPPFVWMSLGLVALAFYVVIVWEANGAAEDNAAREAAAVADAYWQTAVMPQPQRDHIRALLAEYPKLVADKEWDRLAVGESNFE